MAYRRFLHTAMEDKKDTRNRILFNRIFSFVIITATSLISAQRLHLHWQQDGNTDTAIPL